MTTPFAASMRTLRSILRVALVLAVPMLAPHTGTAAMVASGGVIEGNVVDRKTGAPLPNAVVVLQCTCLADTPTALTDENGHYRFEGLSAGKYTVQVLVGSADVSRVVELRRKATRRASFSVDPQASSERTLLEAKQVGRELDMQEFHDIPIGNATSRSFTAVVESSSTAAGMAGVDLTQVEPSNREGYAHVAESEFVDVGDHPLSTFSADVDTASYANVRRFVAQGSLPPPDAVRIEELLNYFPYSYTTPPPDRPIAVNWEIAACPWRSGHLLARIGLQTKPVADAKLARRNLVFLIDVSGSMADANKLPLLRRSLTLLVEQLRGQDTVAIVVYAGAAGVVLPPTSGNDKATIRDAIAELESGGSTNGADGILTAYALAREHFVRRGINRVILATDGDFNVGTTSDGELVRLIERERESGIFLSVLGFGEGNLQDAKMEQLADKGNGNYAYIDSLHEARKVLVEQAGATLATVAKDVKLQVEFNPAKVASYRLIGYENRRLADEDFDDDSKDAGEMGAGHSVTALYELVPAGPTSPGRRRGRLRYQSERTRTAAAAAGEWMTVSVRSKAPDGKRSGLQEVPMAGTPAAFSAASVDFRFAAAVAQYGMLLRGSRHGGETNWSRVQQQAEAARGTDPGGHREAFVELVRATRALADR